MREDWVDIAKAISIICIVLWHMQFNLFLPFLNFKLLLAGIWPVPVFFMIGGFFLNDNKLSDTKSFIIKKIKTIYLPTIIIYLLASLFHNIFINIGFYNLSIDYDIHLDLYDLKDFIIHIGLAFFMADSELIVAPMWFVCVLFVALCSMSIICYILKKYITNERTYNIIQLTCFLMPVVLYFIIINIMPFHIPRYNWLLPAIWLIYIGMKIKNSYNIEFNNNLLFTFSIGVVYLFSITIDNISNNILFLTICTFSACYVVCFISKKITQNNYLSIILTFIGKNSFYIMAFHLIAFKMCTLLLQSIGIHRNLGLLIAPTENNVFLICYYVIGGVCIPLAMIYLFRLIKNIICY